MNWSIFAGLIAPLFCTGAFFAYGTRFKTSTARPSSASTLAAQSGLLTALAILIPLAVAWSPWSRTSGWRWWFLFGAEGSGVFLMLATIYWMTEIQAVDSFELKTKPGLARCYNATWISLIFLAIAIVAPILDGAGETSPGSPEGAGRARFAVAHDLPELHADRQGIETAWGVPLHATEWGLVYRTKEDMIVFCLDHDGRAQRIIETQEEKVDALGALCK